MEESKGEGLMESFIDSRSALLCSACLRALHRWVVTGLTFSLFISFRVRLVLCGMVVRPIYGLGRGLGFFSERATLL